MSQSTVERFASLHASTAFIVAFVVAVPSFFALGRRIGDRIEAETRIRIAEEFAPLAKRSDPSAENAHAAKAGGRWWVESERFGAEVGRAVDLRSSPELLEGLFPGYPASMAGDGPTWKRYFGREFDFDARNARLPEPARYKVAMSWAGCLDVFEGHGADTVVVGNSETYQGLVPSELAASMGGPANRVLFCTRGSSIGRLVGHTASALSELSGGKRIPRIVWGYSFWTDFVRDWREDLERNQDAVFERYRTSRTAPPPAEPAAQGWGDRLKGAWGWKGKPVDWNGLTGLRWDWIDRLGFFRREAFDLRSGTIARGSLHQPRNVAGFYLSSEAAGSEVGELAGQAGAYQPLFKGMRPGDCEPESVAAASSRLDATLAKLLAAADRVHVYLVPTTPLHRAAAPECLYEAARRMLASKRSERVRVLDDDWREYGLDWPDFVHPTSNPALAFLDPHHTNYAGATKTSRAVGRWIAGEPGRTGSPR